MTQETTPSGTDRIAKARAAMTLAAIEWGKDISNKAAATKFDDCVAELEAATLAQQAAHNAVSWRADPIMAGYQINGYRIVRGDEGPIARTIVQDEGFDEEAATLIVDALNAYNAPAATQADPAVSVDEGLAEIGRAFLTTLRNPAVRWYKTGASTFLQSVAEACGPGALNAWKDPPTLNDAPTPDVEQQARELLTAEYERGGLPHFKYSILHAPVDAALRAIVAALRQQQAASDAVAEVFAEPHKLFPDEMTFDVRLIGSPNLAHGTKLYAYPAQAAQPHDARFGMDLLTRLDACAECEQAPLAPLLSDAAAEIRRLRYCAVAQVATGAVAWEVSDGTTKSFASKESDAAPWRGEPGYTIRPLVYGDVAPTRNTADQAAVVDTEILHAFEHKFWQAVELSGSRDFDHDVCKELRDFRELTAALEAAPTRTTEQAAQRPVAVIEKASDRHGSYYTHCDVTLRVYDGFVPEVGQHLYLEPIKSREQEKFTAADNYGHADGCSCANSYHPYSITMSCCHGRAAQSQAAGDAIDLRRFKPALLGWKAYTQNRMAAGRIEDAQWRAEDAEAGALLAIIDAAEGGHLGLDDEQCVAIYNAVTRSNFTRDVKTAERKSDIVRQALAKSPE